MTDLPTEFLEESELLAEFHRAGIFTDEERAERERAVREQKSRYDMQKAVGQMLAQSQFGGITTKPQALMDAFQNDAFRQQQQMGNQLGNVGGLMGGLLGGLGQLGPRSGY